MKTMMKRIVSFALAALLVLGMAAVTGATALDVTNPTVTITEVENGDTVKAYKLISYKDANYNEYELTQTLSGISAPSRQQPSRTSPPRRTSKS